MMLDLDGLPVAPAADRGRSEALQEHVRQAVADAGGSISFARYMEIALYTPNLGYYSGRGEQFGTTGDFVTAPGVSPLFGRCVAAYLAPVLEYLGEGDVLEFGPGNGVLAASVLTALAALDRVPRRYRLLDLSGTLQATQRATLATLDGALRDRIEWLDRLPGGGLEGCILANEVADAVPFHRVRLGGGAPLERRVGWGEDGPVWVLGAPGDAAVIAAVDRIAALPVAGEPYDTEVAPARRAWLASAGEILTRGAMLILDYGFERRELYRPGRHRGTLACHYRHRTHDDPLILTGLQDITSHVDFTDLAEAAFETGLAVAGFTTQAQFLLGQGLLDMAGLGSGASAAAELAVSGQIKRLTMPGEMGEVFKALALGRGVPQDRLAFRGRDLRARL